MVAILEFLELVRKGVRAFRGHILKPMTDSEHGRLLRPATVFEMQQAVKA